MPCSWGVKAGRFVCGWQVKLCDPLVTHASYLSTLETGHYKALYKVTFFTDTVPTHTTYRQTQATETVLIKRATTSLQQQLLHCVSKKCPTFKLSLTLSNLNRFSKFLHYWKAYKFRYKTDTTLPTSP